MAEIHNFLPIISIICGTLNVLIIKWSDSLEAEDVCGLSRHFYHPFFQTIIMFLGQVICLATYKIVKLILSRRGDDSENINFVTSGNRNYSITIFILPSLCDMIASSMLLSALYITNASSWQMIKGVSLIFVSLFGVNYLNQNLKIYNWLGILTIVVSIIVIVVSDVTHLNIYDSKAILTADLLIICSQIFHAIQYVYEEKWIKTLDIAPMQAVGWQGVFGFFQSLLLILPFNFIRIDPPFNNNSNGSIEYLPDAFNQLFKNPILIVSHMIFLFSVALYNYSAVAVMKDTSSTSRIIIDTFRVVPIYIISILIEREFLSAPTVISFFILLCGIFAYKNVVFCEIYKWVLRRITRRRYEDIDNESNVISSPADSVEA